MAQRQFRSDDTDSWLYGFGNGSDGSKTVSASEDYDGANASCSGSSGTTSLTLGAASTFADGDLVLIHQTRGTGVGAWELNKIASGGGSTSITLTHNLINTYTDSGASQAQIVELKQYSSVTVNGSQTWSAPAWDGDKGGIIAFLSSGAVTVTGNISATGKGYLGANLGTGTGVGGQGEGSAAARNTRAQSANGNGGGGGNPSGTTPYSGGGGGGGHGAAGTNGSNGNVTGGTAGTQVGTAGLTTLYFGGGGGQGGHQVSNNYGGGGEGGGVVLIIAQSISVAGTVVANGTNGSDAPALNENGGAGGGAGGSVLLKGASITLGSTLVTATAGSGGADGGGVGNGAAGGNGAVGRIHADYSGSISGTTSPAIDSTQDTTIVGIATAGASFLFNFT